jgi:hypothetical protein
MLMIVGVDVRSDLGCKFVLLVVSRNIDLQNSGETDFKFDATVLVEEIIPDVFCTRMISYAEIDMATDTPTVVSQRADHTDNKSATANSLRTTTRTIISMFPKDTGIFFVYTDNILDNHRTTIMCHKCSGLCPG